MKQAVKDIGNDVIHTDCCCKCCMLVFEVLWAFQIE